MPSVMMKQSIRFFLMLFLATSLWACGEDEPLPEPEKGECTVLVYLAADNSLSSFASSDYAEMKAGMASVSSSGMRLLVYLDTGSSPRLVELKNKNGVVTEEVVKSYSARNSVGVEETKEVFNDVFGNSAYEADRYGLVYWSHADGWVPYPLASSKGNTRWIGQDTGSGDKRMNLSDFSAVLSEAAPHLDFLLLDACFVSSVEVAYELRNYTDFYLGSPTETPGPGAPYDKIVPLMFAEQDAAVQMADAYFNVYNDKYNGGIGITNDNWTGGVSISVIRTSALQQLAAATKQALQGVDSAPAADLRSQVFDYDKRRSSSYVGYFDLKDLMQSVLGTTEFDTWKRAFDAVEGYWKTTAKNYSSQAGMFSMEGANGITHYIPSGNDTAADAAYRSTSWYSAAGLSALAW